MADIPLDDDDMEAAAVAEAMGFTGFGMQRPAKRKFNANADAAVDGGEISSGKKGGNVSKTGANNAPLGARRHLPLPAASFPPRPTAAGAEAKDAEEIDLGGDEDEEGMSSTDALFQSRPNVWDGHSTFSSGHLSSDIESTTAQPRHNNTVIDNGPPGLPARPSHPPRGHSHQRGRGGRGGSGHGSRPIGDTGMPWWEGYYDARMNENPWDKLEKERGLQPRGTWASRNGGHGVVTAVLPPEHSGKNEAEAADLPAVQEP